MFGLALSRLGLETIKGAGAAPPPPVPIAPGAPVYTGDVHVRRTAEDYGNALLGLLPYGQAWPRSPDSILVQAVYGLAAIFGYVDSRAADLLEIESDPRTTVELLPDWERAWGLPDPCLTNPPNTIYARQQALVAWMTLLGGQSRQFYINYLAQMPDPGPYKIYISEYAPFMCGVSRCGNTTAEDIKAGGDGQHMRWELGPPEMRFYWSVHPGPVDLIWFRCGQGGRVFNPGNPSGGAWHGGGQCGVDPLCRINNFPDMECVLNRWQPAHTQVVLDYSGGGISNPMQGTP